jgi:hypothetical protein
MKCVKVLNLLLISASVALSLITDYSVAAEAQTNLKATPTNASQIVVRGKVFCMDESGHRLDSKQDCSNGVHLYEIVTIDNKRYRFSSDDAMTAMFKEPKVREMDLQIIGELYDKNILEIANLRALRNEKLYDIYYYCEICSITAYGPGDCACCYNPLEFKEKPALDN